jgi:methionyl-tRNA formyltransferase
MRIIFAGTPEFSVPVLQVLIDSPHSVVGVFTQPDRPAGRGRKLQQSPVKQLALQHDLPVLQPSSLKPPEQQKILKDLQPDLMVVVAYGLLLPQTILDIPGSGCVNLHASLLPRWRGAAPIQRAILEGDANTGVCLMHMEAGLDTGPVLASETCGITETDTGGELHDRLSEMSARLLAANLDGLENKTLTAVVQDDQLATYARKLQKSEAVIDWAQTARQIDCRVRAFNPWPVAQTHYEDKVLRIWKSEPADYDGSQKPGSVISADKHGILVACGEAALRLQEIQLPGGKRLAAAQFLNAHTMASVVFN